MWGGKASPSGEQTETQPPGARAGSSERDRAWQGVGLGVVFLVLALPYFTPGGDRRPSFPAQASRGWLLCGYRGPSPTHFFIRTRLTGVLTVIARWLTAAHIRITFLWRPNAPFLVRVQRLVLVTHLPGVLGCPMEAASQHKLRMKLRWESFMSILFEKPGSQTTL